jgi:hypothetical protein
MVERPEPACGRFRCIDELEERAAPRPRLVCMSDLSVKVSGSIRRQTAVGDGVHLNGWDGSSAVSVDTAPDYFSSQTCL